MKRWFCGLLLSVCCVLSFAQSLAFTVEIHAPDEIRALLEKHLELQRYTVITDLSDAELQRLMLTAEDQARDLLATLGYFDPEITFHIQDPIASASAPGQRVVLIDVAAGEQTRVSAIHWSFDGAITTEPDAQQATHLIEGGWTLPVGLPFTQAQWDSAKQQVLAALVAQRYAAAQLVDSKADVQPDQHSAELTLHLDSGPAYYLGDLQVEGLSRYPRALVEGLINLPPGTVYQHSQLIQAQQRLTDSGFFDAAYLTLDLTTDPARATVLAVVRESAMQKLEFGVGASTDTGFRVSVEHTHNQVPGVGWRAVNKLTADRDTSAFSSDWTSQPDGSAWRWAASALFQNQRIGEIDVVSQRYRSGRFLGGVEVDHSYYLQYDRSDVKYRESNKSETNDAISANYAFNLRNFDSLPFPNQGWGIGGELALGTTLGEISEPFNRVLLRWRDLQPLGFSADAAYERQRAGRLALRAEVGTVVVNNTNAIPFTQLFLAGGDNSVRGYKWQEIGVVRDGEITAEAGRYLASGSIEWQRPITVNGVMTAWESDVFVDAGAVANEPAALDLKVGVGAGVRWKSPIGPLQADIAYGVAVQKFRLHLSVGFVF
jgi:translocation and assembly module TamA